jgi:hypothetical protein
MNTNLIIIGAKRADIEMSNDYMEWNNPNQASYFVLKQLLLEIKNMKIFCLDGDYPKNITCSDIQFVQEYYNLADTKYFDINSHNIIIDFCNLLNENWCSSTTNYNIYDEKYNITFVACGCCWEVDFPVDTLKTIIQHKLYTPLDPMNITSYLTSISYSVEFPIETLEYMKPFYKGIYQILGTLMYRGYSQNYNLEEPLRELFKIIDSPLNSSHDDEFKLFLNGSIHWNQLSRTIRLLMTKYVYNIDIK